MVWLLDTLGSAVGGVADAATSFVAELSELSLAEVLDPCVRTHHSLQRTQGLSLAQPAASRECLYRLHAMMLQSAMC